MDYKKLVKDYTDECIRVESFKQEHSKVFEALDQLQSRKSDLENSLKEMARVKGDAENSYLSISVATPFKKWYDYDLLLEKADENEKVMLENCKIVSIDKSRVDQLAKGELIKKEVLQHAYKEEKQTPRVTIKIKKGKEEDDN